MARLLNAPDAPRNPQGPDQFQLDAWIDTAPFEDLLGLRIDQIGKGQATLRMPFLLKHCQGGGLMHGGALTALADTAVAMAIKSLLPEGSMFATTDLTMQFFAPVSSGEVTAVAEVRGPDGRTFHGQASLRDCSGKEVARFTSIFRLARKRTEGG